MDTYLDDHLTTTVDSRSTDGGGDQQAKKDSREKAKKDTTEKQATKETKVTTETREAQEKQEKKEKQENTYAIYESDCDTMDTRGYLDDLLKN